MFFFIITDNWTTRPSTMSLQSMTLVIFWVHFSNVPDTVSTKNAPKRCSVHHQEILQILLLHCNFFVWRSRSPFFFFTDLLSPINQSFRTEVLVEWARLFFKIVFDQVEDITHHLYTLFLFFGIYSYIFLSLPPSFFIASKDGRPATLRYYDSEEISAWILPSILERRV